jgi:hypothetical protein
VVAAAPQCPGPQPLAAGVVGAAWAWACFAGLAGGATGLPVPIGAGRVLKRTFILSTQPVKASLSALTRLKSATLRRLVETPVSAMRRASGLCAASKNPLYWPFRRASAASSPARL